VATRSFLTGSCFGVLALCATSVGGCLGSSSAGNDGGGGAEDSGSSSGVSASGSGGSSGAASSSGTGSSSGDSGGSRDAAGGGSGSSGGAGTALTPDATGYVSVTALNIQGAWYGYGDCWGTNGAPPGVCESTGGFPAGECSSITFPLPPSTSDAGEGGAPAVFTQTTPGTMCLSGTAAKVINGTNGKPDYSDIFGIGIGLDFNNQMGTKAAYDATSNKVTGFSFTLSGVPSAGIRVEFPTTDTTATGNDSYAFSAGGQVTVTKDGTYTADMTTATTDAHPLSDSFAPSGFTQPSFNASHLLSIQFHVPTNTTAAIPVTNMCVSNLTAIVSH